MGAKHLFHKLTLRAFAHQTEIIEAVKDAIAYLIVGGQGDINTVKDDINVEITEGYFGNRIAILECEVSPKDAVSIFDRVIESNTPNYLHSIINEKIDDTCVLHLRFDKDKILLGSRYLKEGNREKGLKYIYKIVEGQNVVKALFKVRAYPAKRRVAISILQEHIKGYIVD